MSKKRPCGLDYCPQEEIVGAYASCTACAWGNDSDDESEAEIERSRGMIIIGYQGIGKSTLCKNNPRYIDFESSALKMFGCRIPNWQISYCQMAIWLSQQGYVVFTSSHKEVREMLKDCGEYCIAIVPTKELKKQWIERLYDRYEKSGLEKDRNAYLNAVDRYEANLTEIEEDIADTFLIDSMDYDLQRIVSKCEQIEKIVKGTDDDKA